MPTLCRYLQQPEAALRKRTLRWSLPCSGLCTDGVPVCLGSRALACRSSLQVGGP